MSKLPSGVPCLLLMIFSGCIPALHNRVPENTLTPNRVVAMPPRLVVYNLDASDHREYESHSTGGLSTEVRAEVNSAMRARGGQVIQPERFAKCGVPCAQFFRWGGVATLEIGLQREEIRNYGLHSVADWGYPSDLSPIRSALDADLVLFVVLKQTRQTTGRKVLMALGGGYTVGKQIDVACIADLRDGRMTWCASERDDKGDLADRGRVAAVVRNLLNGAFVGGREP